jgi:hypothetical protein
LGQAIHSFERIEWLVDPQAKYANPFDPDEIAIDATLSGPGGRTIKLPAFWSRNFTGNTFGFDDHSKATPTGDGEWVVRFCAPATGTWSMQVVIRDRTGERRCEPIQFEVVSRDDTSGASGFVRRSRENSKYLQLDSGQAFFPVGLNIAWGGERGSDSFGQFFERLSTVGGNFARIWMCNPGRMTETREVGVGRLDLSSCAYYDAVLESAAKNGIYCTITFGNYRDLRLRDNWGECIWPRFPYNAANGGPCTRPADFFTDASANKFYKNRLRYVVARYSAFTNVAFWEFWNEQDLSGVDLPVEWIREMATYLKEHDPYQHLVTTSFAHGFHPEVWRLPQIDLAQVHYYGDGEDVTDFTPVIYSAAAQHDALNKPFVVAELGISAMGPDIKYDADGAGTALHDGLWAAMMSGAAGTSWHWWWDNYVEPKNVWQMYRGIAKFSATVDWPRRHFTCMTVPPPIRTSTQPQTLEDVILSGSGAWGHVQDEPIVVPPNGQVLSVLPKYYVGPAKPELHRPLKLVVDLPQATTMSLHVGQVSDFGQIRVAVDDQSVADFPFSALPGMPDPEKPPKRREEPPHYYLADINKDRQVQILAGKHTIEIQNASGDWVTIGRITFAKSKSSRYADVTAIGLEDASSGERILWLHDVKSNWKNDQAGIKPQELADVEVAVPAGSNQKLLIEWWDTRSGEIVRRDTASAENGVVKLLAPPFARDIALRATPAK